MRLFLFLTFIGVFLLTAVSPSFGLSPYAKGTTGVDLSWPNCAEKISNNISFGIVGINGGLNFHPNPCIGSESAHFRQNLSLYLNTGFPGTKYAQKYQNLPKACASTDEVCLAYNYGFNAGKYAINYMLSQGVVSQNFWLDVEQINSWSSNTQANRSDLDGEVAALQTLKPELVGFYAYPNGWDALTSSWQNHLPAWVASNSNFRSVALSYCGNIGFVGGVTMITQYVNSLDQDYAC